jgi:hypothetical protein
MIISAQYINKPRKIRRCAVCGLPMEGIQTRLYGSAYRGDPPYVVMTHPDCAPIEAWPKLNQAAQAAESTTEQRT